MKLPKDKVYYLAMSLLAVFITLSLTIPHFSILAIIVVLAIFGITRYSTNSDDTFADLQDPIILLSNFRFQKHMYLQSDIWKAKRKARLQYDSYTCQHCGQSHHLQVHHVRGYDLIPNEPISDLLTLCENCHTALHEQLGYPQTYNDYMKWGY